MTLAFIVGFAITTSVMARGEINLDESYSSDGFVNYLPYEVKKKEEKKEEKKNVQNEINSSGTKSEKKETRENVTVEWLRTNYPKLQDAALDDPDNMDKMAAYLYTKRIVLDKAQRFSNSVMEMYRTDPLLNENNRIPYASGGATSVRRASLLGERKALTELAKIGGVLLFVDGKCRFCKDIIPVMETLKGSHELAYLVVSIDGTSPPNYKGEIKLDNGLFRRIGLRLTPSVVYIPHPKAYQFDDPNKYYVVSQGFYPQDEMTKQFAYMGYRQKLLSNEVKQELAVWDRGVASTEDLKELKLDINRPEEFKQILEPMLYKQYQ